jgi:excisionase family DNA binding protein
MSEPSPALEKDDPKILRGEVMNVNGAAEYLGLASSTIYDKVRDLEMPHTRIGNLIRFRKKDIDHWLGENTVRPHPNLQKALAEVAERFFFNNWLLSVGLDPDDYQAERANKALRESLAKFAPETEE